MFQQRAPPTQDRQKPAVEEGVERIAIAARHFLEGGPYIACNLAQY